MIKAVIFDMDGVLIDAKEWHYDALNRALRLFGYEINKYEHATTFDGLPTKTKLQLLSKERQLPEALHDFINEMKQRYTLEMVSIKCKPRFNHQYALAKLRANGYKMAVASNSVRASIELMMQKSELADFFEFLISNQDVTKSKPDPEMYTLAIERLQLIPSECLIIEDNENGVRAAQASGAHVLQVRDITEVNWENIEKKIIACNAIAS